MNKFVALLILLIFSSNAFSQELYTPRNIKKAYEKGTRSFDGKPGKNYWQNGGEYKIDFKVYPTTKIVSGVETINYSNNSPYAHLNFAHYYTIFHNIYKYIFS